MLKTRRWLEPTLGYDLEYNDNMLKEVTVGQSGKIHHVNIGEKLIVSASGYLERGDQEPLSR